jgi:hypothetical protein
MSFLKLVFLGLLVTFFGLKPVLAECNNSGYGSSKCENDSKEFIVEKKVKKSNTDSKEEKITNVRKGENFTYTFKIKNNTNKDKTLKLVDNLPKEFERVSGIGFTEDVLIPGNSTKSLEMVVKVKDSEFEGKSNFEKCVVNKAYIYRGDKEEDSSTATVCFGDGSKITTLPKTGTNSLVLGASLLSTLLGFGLTRLRR